jgi:hypothetical protein
MALRVNGKEHTYIGKEVTCEHVSQKKQSCKKTDLTTKNR